jgi:Xaa-Pro aminopeptidase
MDTGLSNLRKLMKKQQLDAVLISSVPNIIYITGYNGFSPIEREAYLLITYKKAFLIVSALHIVEAKKMAKNVTVLERTRDNPLKGIILELIKNYNINACGFESESLTHAEYAFVSSLFTKFIPADLSDLRLKKTSHEISSIRKACTLGDEAYAHILKEIKVGMTEKQIALEIEWFIRAAGHDISFPPVVAFEENAAIPHHNSNNKKLKNNNLVLLDFGAKVDNYCSDMTRVFFFGKASREHKKVHKAVVDAQQEAIEYTEKKLIKKEKPIAAFVDSRARDYTLSLGYPPFNHSSHGIGLEVHENPHISSSKKPLENGTVFSIEPGIYLPGKFGVRIEDLFAIKDNKLIPLTHSPKELIEI